MMSAYAIAPGFGSERGVGWRRALVAAREFDTWVLCRNRDFRGHIEPWIEKNGPIPGLSFYPIALRPFERRLERISELNFFVCRLWQRRAYLAAIELHRKIRFDAIHHATWNGYREPGYLWRLDAAFVWGPVGGTQDYPWRFLALAGFEGAFREGLRSLVNQAELRFGRRIRRVARRSDVIMAANTHGVGAFERWLGVTPHRVPEIGVDEVSSSRADSKPRARPLRILWSGVLVHRKALHLLLMALGELGGKVPFELKILGDGPLRARWQSLARRCGVNDRCLWCGLLPFERAVAENRWADVLAFTSMRDTSGTVVLEALAHGVPTICFDQFGAGDIVTNDCGIKIPVTNPTEGITALAEAIKRLARDPGLLQSLSEGAIKRAREYLWTDNGRRVLGLINSAIDSRQTA